jgi:hypothetical protein
MSSPPGAWAWGSPPNLFRRVDLAPPPRPVSLGARLAVIFHGGIQIIALIASFGFLFFWIFAFDSELVTRFEFRGPVEQVTGTVTAVRATNASENKRRVRAVDFTYESGGTARRGTSYTVRAVPPEGSEVPVEYLRDRPQIARIQGLRRRTFGDASAFVAIFPAIASVLFFIMLARSIGRAGLLAAGHLGYAKLVAKEPTGAKVNNKRVYKLTFELDLPPEATPEAYRAAWSQWSKKHRFTFKTHETTKLEDEPEEPVLYLPDKPGSGLPLDTASLRITPSGGLEADGSPPLRLLMPALVIANIVAVVIALL